VVVEGASGASGRRVVIVDDHAAFTDMFTVALQSVDDLECVGSAGSLAEALRVVADTDPDIVVVDLALGEDDGLDVVRRLRAEHEDLVLVVASRIANVPPKTAAPAASRAASLIARRPPVTCCGMLAATELMGRGSLRPP
jgi:chemotaxis response regulator CheB